LTDRETSYDHERNLTTDLGTAQDIADVE